MSEQPRVILVGHCGFDAPRLEAEVSKCLPRCDVVTINSELELEEMVDEGEDALLLVNRQLPYGFEEEEGVDLVKDLHRRHPHLKMMLISDRPDAQEDAQEAGAIRGFGKGDLGTGRVVECLKRAMAGQQPA